MRYKFDMLNAGQKIQKGKSFYIGTQKVTVCLEGQTTEPSCSILNMQHPINTGPPLHVHANEDEIFYIVEGSYRFRIGDEVIECHKGDTIYAHRNIPHCFTCIGEQAGEMLVTFVPGGAEKYFEKMAEVSQDDPERSIKCQALDKEFGIKILGGFV